MSTHTEQAARRVADTQTALDAAEEAVVRAEARARETRLARENATATTSEAALSKLVAADIGAAEHLAICRREYERAAREHQRATAAAEHAGRADELVLQQSGVARVLALQAEIDVLLEQVNRLRAAQHAAFVNGVAPYNEPWTRPYSFAIAPPNHYESAAHVVRAHHQERAA